MLHGPIFRVTHSFSAALSETEQQSVLGIYTTRDCYGYSDSALERRIELLAGID